MSEISVHRRHVTLPWAIAYAIAAGVFAAGGTFAVLKADLDGNREHTVRVERESVERDNRLERRVEKLEDTTTKLLGVAERIDERTAQTQRDIVELKARAR